MGLMSPGLLDALERCWNRIVLNSLFYKIKYLRVWVSIVFFKSAKLCELRFLSYCMPVKGRITELTTGLRKTNSKEAISMWPDMHSFDQIHTLEPIVFFLFYVWEADHVLRFTTFTDSNCSTFYRIHKFEPKSVPKISPTKYIEK